MSKKPKQQPKGTERVFTAHDIEILRRDPFIAKLLGIEHIPKRPNVKVKPMNLKEYL